MTREERLEHLLKKYSYGGKQETKGPGPGGPGGPHGGMGGKPKNTKQTFKRLFSYISAYKGLLIVGLLCVVLSTVSTLAGSYMLRPIINDFIAPENGQGNLQGLAIALVVMAGVYALGIIATYFQSRIMVHISQNALQKIRDDLYGKMQQLPIRFFDTNSHGELMSRYTNDWITSAIC